MLFSKMTSALALLACVASTGCSANEDETTPAGDAPAMPDRASDPTNPSPTPPANETPKPPDINVPEVPPAPPPGPKERTILAIDGENNLVTFLAKEPAKVTAKKVSGLAANEKLLGIDVRPSTGVLYALGSQSRIYTIDRATGAATAVGTGLTPGLQGQSFGFDFNPVADAIRIHSDFNQNLRVSPATGAVVMADKALVFDEKDPNFQQDPNIVATAYTNSVMPKPTETTLYAIDSTRDILVKVAPPNDGKVTTVGKLDVDLTNAAGFDIYGTGDKTEAYAALQIAGAKMPDLYKIDLTTGKATRVDSIGHPKPIEGIAIEP